MNDEKNLSKTKEMKLFLNHPFSAALQKGGFYVWVQNRNPEVLYLVVSGQVFREVQTVFILLIQRLTVSSEGVGRPKKTTWGIVGKWESAWPQREQPL